MFLVRAYQFAFLNGELEILYNARALLNFRKTAKNTRMLSAKIFLVASNAFVSLDIKVPTRIAKMKMNASQGSMNAVHMQIAQTQSVLTSANAKKVLVAVVDYAQT